MLEYNSVLYSDKFAYKQLRGLWKVIVCAKGEWDVCRKHCGRNFNVHWDWNDTRPRRQHRHHTPTPSSHSSQPDLQHSTPLTRRFLLETSSPFTADDHQRPVTSSRSTSEGWRSRDYSQLTVTSRCRSLPGRMHEGSSGVDGWQQRSSVSYRQSRGAAAAAAAAARRSADSSSVPLRARRAHNYHHQQQQQQQQAAGTSALYPRHLTSSPTYVTPSSHLTLPHTHHRSRATGKSYVTSHDVTGGRGSVSLSHFSWPGASFDLQTGLADDDEARSSGGTQGAAEPTSPSLPSSTSTATNAACTRLAPPLNATNDDITPSNGDADTEIADVTAAGGSADNGDVTTCFSDVRKEDEERELPAEVIRRRRRRSCEFNLLDDDDFWAAEGRGDDVTGEWAWSTARPDWADVICVSDDNQLTTTTTTGTTTTAAAADAVGDEDDVTQRAINETVMKCIESCDKVLLRHSTAIR